MHHNTKSVTSIPAALFVWAASNTVFSSLLLSPRFNSIAVDMFLYCFAGSTTIEIIGLECEVYCSHNHGIVNMCRGNMAAQ